MNYRVFGKMSIVMCCLTIVLVCLSASVSADNWVPISRDDATLYMDNTGVWRVAGWNPSTSTQGERIVLNMEMLSKEKMRIGWKSVGEKWLFYQQDYAPGNLKNPDQPDRRQMGYYQRIQGEFIPVILDALLLDGNKVVFGVKGDVIISVGPEKGRHPIQFYREKN